MVFAVISELGSLFKIHDRDTKVDSFVFRLHYRWTGSALFVASILVCASDYIGDPIQCIVGGEEAHKAINTFCWIQSTYTLNQYWYPIKDNQDVKVYGLGQYTEDTERRFHYYYQWVPAVLFFMGLFFYVPHTVWKVTEKQLVDKLLQGIDGSQVIEDHTDKKNNITKYLNETRAINLNWHFGLVYLVCEALNLVNVCVQLKVLDNFFGGVMQHYGSGLVTLLKEKLYGGTFISYGSEVWQYWFSGDPSAHDPMEIAFPRLTKCDFYNFGTSGSVEKVDAFCVLGQNIFNEKLFLGIWFWFVILAIITLGSLIYESVRMFGAVLRSRIIEGYTRNKCDPSTKAFVRGLHTGDFCLLTLLAKNLDMVSFRDILKNMVEHTPANNNVPMDIELKDMRD